MNKIRVLFVCVYNSARSQIAEGLLNYIAGDRFEAESAGLEPGHLGPQIIKAMAESGIDISKQYSKQITEVLKSGKRFDYVIALCDAANAQRCPAVPGARKYLNWSFPDPLQVHGTDAEIMNEIGEVREAIKNKIESWLTEMEKDNSTTPDIPTFKV